MAARRGGPAPSPHMVPPTKPPEHHPPNITPQNTAFQNIAPPSPIHARHSCEVAHCPACTGHPVQHDVTCHLSLICCHTECDRPSATGHLLLSARPRSHCVPRQHVTLSITQCMHAVTRPLSNSLLANVTCWGEFPCRNVWFSSCLCVSGTPHKALSILLWADTGGDWSPSLLFLL